MTTELDALRRQAIIDTRALAEYRATIERVKAIHVGSSTPTRWCVEDKRDWPCPTIRALEQP